MHKFIRGGAAVMVFVAAYLFSYWLLWVHIFPWEYSSLASLAALVTGVAAAITAYRAFAADGKGRAAAIAGGALLGAAVGFVGGFFGPMLLAPEANQGPLLGFFITGPLGFVVGGICGVFFPRRNS